MCHLFFCNCLSSPFPSPSELDIKWSEVQWKSLICVRFCDPMDCIAHGILQARILDWVDFPFSRGSSQPRDWNQVSHIAGGFFTSWATKEALQTPNSNHSFEVFIAECFLVYALCTWKWICFSLIHLSFVSQIYRTKPINLRWGEEKNLLPPY